MPKIERASPSLILFAIAEVVSVPMHIEYSEVSTLQKRIIMDWSYNQKERRKVDEKSCGVERKRR
ncbi:hypothetical protein DICVIV_08885 [Dictyocaulus viviparus]|uniref:Uncharacterized protein n=1 Tax=Dictyocaulus viviparus TaxID=29172 RepID=A0A0D8XKC1_DICVI|nr:hypothetical protein DICVIV_08885 [Dictyocaulus viviparus]